MKRFARAMIVVVLSSRALADSATSFLPFDDHPLSRTWASPAQFVQYDASTSFSAMGIENFEARDQGESASYERSMKQASSSMSIGHAMPYRDSFIIGVVASQLVSDYSESYGYTVAGSETHGGAMDLGGTIRSHLQVTSISSIVASGMFAPFVFVVSGTNERITYESTYGVESLTHLLVEPAILFRGALAECGVTYRPEGRKTDLGEPQSLERPAVMKIHGWIIVNPQLSLGTILRGEEGNGVDEAQTRKYPLDRTSILLGLRWQDSDARFRFTGAWEYFRESEEAKGRDTSGTTQSRGIHVSLDNILSRKLLLGAAVGYWTFPRADYGKTWGTQVRASFKL